MRVRLHAEVLAFLAALVLLLGASPAWGQACQDWTPGFHFPSTNGTVHASIVHADLGGPALFLGGEFDSAFGSPVNRVVRWDGTRASDTDGGLDGTVRAFATYDAGFGAPPRLYAGGDFTTAGGFPVNHIARWNGTRWVRTTPLGLDGPVYTMAVFDEGTGKDWLYVGGSFSSNSNNVAVWDGTLWGNLHNGVGGPVFALQVFDDGNGPALYAGGSFTSPSSNIARWTGTWVDVGGGVDGAVRALAVFDDGTGPALYATGSFQNAGGSQASQIARWDGTSWTPVGAGLSGTSGGFALLPYDDGSGDSLFVAGVFATAGGMAAPLAAKWDGTSWTALVSEAPLGIAHTLTPFDDGRGRQLWMGGSFSKVDDAPGSAVTWDGTRWNPADRGNGWSGGISSIATYDDGNETVLLAGALTGNAGGVTIDRLAEWDGEAWSEFPATPHQTPLAYATFDDGSGPSLHAGGDFPPAGSGLEAFGIAKWDGAAWIPLASGFSNGARGFPPPPLAVNDLQVFDDGTGMALYACGSFTSIQGTDVNQMARWDGVSWSPVGDGLIVGDVEALTVHDDGSGSSLYAAGSFTLSGLDSVRHVARWTGSDWVQVGDLSNRVNDLEVFDDGNGVQLYAGTNHFPEENSIFRWDGATWSVVGDGFDEVVFDLSLHDDGSGTALYAGGRFTTSGAVEVNGVARWDGATWSPVGSGVHDTPRVNQIASFDGALYVIGDFTRTGEFAAAEIGRYGPTNLPQRRGTVNTGFGQPVTDVLFLNGSAGDPVYRELTVTADESLSLSIERAPAPGSGGLYAIWVLDGEPDATSCVPLDFRRGSGAVTSLGFGPRCLPLVNTINPGSCPCGSTIPNGFTSRGLGSNLAAALCLHPRPGMPAAPHAIHLSFPAGRYTIAGVIADQASLLQPRVSLTNWLVVTAE